MRSNAFQAPNAEVDALTKTCREIAIEEILRTVLNFPIWKLGYSHIVNIEWNVLRPYENWREDLKKLAVATRYFRAEDRILPQRD
jgi:hypothetical protein